MEQTLHFSREFSHRYDNPVFAPLWQYSTFYSNFWSTVPVAVEEVDVSVTVVSVEGVEDWSELSDIADDGVSFDVCWDDVGVDPD